MNSVHRSLCVLLLVLAASCTATKKSQEKPAVKSATRPAEPALTESQRQKNVESFDVVWTTIRDKHFDPKLNGVDWNASRDELRPKVETAKTMAEARGAMSELLHRLDQTHFAIIPQSVYKRTAKNDDEPDTSSDVDRRRGTTGIDIRVIDGHALVTHVEADSTAAKAGVMPGWELVAVRGAPVAPTIKELGEAVKSESLRPTMQAMTLQSSLRGAVGKTVPASFIDGNGKTVELDLKLQPETGKLVKFGNLPETPLRFECRKLEPNVAYFSLDIFLDPPAVMAPFRKCVSDAVKQNADGFILDLRGNPGGIGFMAVGIGNCFIDKPKQYLGQMSDRQGPGLKFTLDAQPVHYDGPLAILVDECSGSTSEILAGGLRDIGRARVFGVRSAGAALPSVIVMLPNDDRFQYAVANYVSAGGKQLEGQGVVPDQIVVPNRAALLAGKDPILDAALQWIRTQKK